VSDVTQELGQIPKILCPSFRIMWSVASSHCKWWRR